MSNPRNYNAAYRMSGGQHFTACGLNYCPILGSRDEMPDGTGRYAEVISVERDGDAAALREFPIGEQLAVVDRRSA